MSDTTPIQDPDLKAALDHQARLAGTYFREEVAFRQKRELLQVVGRAERNEGEIHGAKRKPSSWSQWFSSYFLGFGTATAAALIALAVLVAPGDPWSRVQPVASIPASETQSRSVTASTLRALESSAVEISLSEDRTKVSLTFGTNLWLRGETTPIPGNPLRATADNISTYAVVAVGRLSSGDIVAVHGLLATGSARTTEGSSKQAERTDSVRLRLSVGLPASEQPATVLEWRHDR
ncbi:MAG: hypothetical protein JNK85_24210 [Verrucomicrobiales bacterium]|nr:hypothetical protein [Verrucomicrobiales bacterium]